MIKKILFYLCACTGLFALTVDEAVEHALKNSKTLQSAAIDLEIKTRAKNTAWNVFVPSVQAAGSLVRNNEVQNPSAGFAQMLNASFAGIPGFSLLPVDTQVGEQERWKAAANIGFSFNFNAALVQEIRVVNADYKAGLIAWEQLVAETERSIRKMFYGLLLLQESVSLQKKMLANAKSRSQQAETAYKNGLISELSFLQAQVAYENQKPDVLKGEQDLRQQLSLFAFLLGLPLDAALVLEGSIDPEFIDVSCEQLTAEYIECRSDLLLLRKNIDLMRLRLSAVSLQAFSPSLSLNYNWQPLVSDITKNWIKDGNNTDKGSFTASIVWNLTNMLSFSSVRQQAKNMETNVQKMEIQYASLLKNAEMEIQTLVDKLKQTRTVIEAGKISSALAQKSYDMTLAAYCNGTAELLEVCDAEASLNQARLRLASEKYNYVSNFLDLEYALNTKLSRAGE